VAKKEKILVVDDERIVLKSCVVILHQKGFDVESADSAREGMRMMQENSYNLVVTDLKMPEIDGIEFIRWIKNNKYKTGIVVITGYPSQETMKEAFELGIIDYVPKPFTPKLLIDVIKRALAFSVKTEKEKKADILPPAMMAEIEKVIQKFMGKPGSLLPILQKTQETVGYLPSEVLKFISQRLKITPAEIHSIVSFYNFFTMNPRGDHTIRVCLGTACYVKRAEEIVRKLSDLLDVELDGVTEDRKFSLEAVRCLGACGLAPVVVIDQDTYAMVDSKKVKNLIDLYRS
jgi:NADH:ubiquinone oxidoreductase subunit E/CheY-like chemotaxis protein